MRTNAELIKYNLVNQYYFFRILSPLLRKYFYNNIYYVNIEYLSNCFRQISKAQFLFWQEKYDIS